MSINYRQENYENEARIKRLYEKIEFKFERKIISLLKEKKLLPNDEIYNIAPDFTDMEEWRISTTVQKSYSSSGNLIQKEEIKSIKGRFFITKRLLNIEPSFIFDFNAGESKFAFNKAELAQILKNDKEREEWSVYSLIGGKDLVVYDKHLSNLKSSIVDKVAPMLKGIGFSEEESNLMVLAAMEQESFTPDTTPEEIIRTALQVRGNVLTKK